MSKSRTFTPHRHTRAPAIAKPVAVLQPAWFNKAQGRSSEPPAPHAPRATQPKAVHRFADVGVVQRTAHPLRAPSLPSQREHGTPDAPVSHKISRLQGSQESVLQREQVGRVHPAGDGAGTHFVYKLDEQRHTFYDLASHYGVSTSAIAAINPTADARRLRIGQRMRIPAINPPGSAPLGPYMGEGALVVNIQNHNVPVRWSPGGNLVGRLPRGTAVLVYDDSSATAWAPSSELHNRADGIVAEMGLRNAVQGSRVYVHVPGDNIRRGDRRPGDDEVNHLARMIWGEQRSQGDDAMTCAAWVARNRYDAGWGQSYTDIVTAGQFQGLVSPSRVEDLTGSDLETWNRAQEIARGVIDNTIPDPTGHRGFYFGNGQRILTNMQACARRSSAFVHGTIEGTNLHWSNGDYTANACTIP